MLTLKYIMKIAADKEVYGELEHPFSPKFSEEEPSGYAPGILRASTKEQVEILMINDTDNSTQAQEQ